MSTSRSSRIGPPKKSVRHRLSSILIALCSARPLILFFILCLSLSIDREPTPFRLPPPLVAVLECSHIHKVGVGTSGDAGRLLGEFPNVKLTGFYDAMDFPITDRIRPHSLVGLMAIFFGVHVSKAARMTNWSAFKLTDAQLQYAALDAWASLLVYTRLSEVPYIIE